MEKEEIKKRVYKILNKTHSGQITDETMMEIISESKTIVGASERNSTIFRQIIMNENQKGIYAKLAQIHNIKLQRIFQLEQYMIEKIYLSDAIKYFNKISTNEEKINEDIEKLGLNNKIEKFLKELHCHKIKDIFNIDEEYLKKISIEKNIDYKIIFDRIKKVGLQKPEDKQKHIKNIEDMDMSSKTYKHLKRNNINTNQDLVNKINELLNNPTIPEESKKQIKQLYENETKKRKNNEQLFDLIKQKQVKEDSLKKSQQAGALLQQKIDSYFDYIKRYLPKEERSIAASQLQYLLDSVERHSKTITKKEEELNEITNMISNTTDTISQRQK